MNDKGVAEWLAGLSTQGKIGALISLYSMLTVGTRQLFSPDLPKGQDGVIVSMLHGINELHHTVASWLLAYVTDETKAFPVTYLERQLNEIAAKYHIEGLLASALGFVQQQGPQ